MKKRTAYGLLALLLLAAAAIIVLSLTGCASVQHMEAQAMGLYPDAPIPQGTYIEHISKPGDYRDVEARCGVASEGNQRIGCSFKTGYESYDICMVWYTEGDLVTRAHERCHCRKGAWHTKNGAPKSPDICRPDDDNGSGG